MEPLLVLGAVAAMAIAVAVIVALLTIKTKEASALAARLDEERRRAAELGARVATLEEAIEQERKHAAGKLARAQAGRFRHEPCSRMPDAGADAGRRGGIRRVRGPVFDRSRLCSGIMV